MKVTSQNDKKLIAFKKYTITVNVEVENARDQELLRKLAEDSSNAYLSIVGDDGESLEYDNSGNNKYSTDESSEADDLMRDIFTQLK